MKKVYAVGSIALIAVLAVVVFFSMNPQEAGLPGGSSNNNGGSQQPALESYTGNLTGITGVIPMNGSSGYSVLDFLDGREFRVDEELAATTNLTAGARYKIQFNSSAPDVAVSILKLEF